MSELSTPIGGYWLHTRGGRIVALTGAPPAERADAGLVALVREWLERYFSGGEPSLEALSLFPAGTGFQQRVWEALRGIPRGRVARYGDMARELGSAPRAVGRALGGNPLPILLPCHRVVAANGALCGYSGPGGVAAKRFLLELEGVSIRENARVNL
ncbi:MAG: methylated-DNA--[protein]-cysteine S-methyltransferase [Magnetococcales bacterium]|nr:methylated-DNA--[protein]-cysteine S-methyltransferase [Magnetococcales bacterium]